MIVRTPLSRVIVCVSWTATSLSPPPHPACLCLPSSLRTPPPYLIATLAYVNICYQTYEERFIFHKLPTKNSDSRIPCSYILLIRIFEDNKRHLHTQSGAIQADISSELMITLLIFCGCQLQPISKLHEWIVLHPIVWLLGCVFLK